MVRLREIHIGGEMVNFHTFHTHSSALFWSNQHMCTLINSLEFYLLDLGDLGLTGGTSGVFFLFWLSYEHLLPH